MESDVIFNFLFEVGVDVNFVSDYLDFIGSIDDGFDKGFIIVL